jgi:hypothetical protein
VGGALAAVAALHVSTAGAQVTTVDEGSFTVSRAGEKVGREEFRIVRQPAGGGTELVARAVAVYGDRRVTPALQTDDAGVPLRYQVEVRSAGGMEQRVAGQLQRGHFHAQVQTPGGESSREYLVPDRAVVLDDELYHQYYFVGLLTAGGARAVPMLVPRRGSQAALSVTASDDDTVTVGGRVLPARHVVFADGAGGTRELWVDRAGRVLKVSVPGTRLIALRDDPPR